MADIKKHKMMLKKLKKRVRQLEKKEEQGRNKLRMALKKMRKLGKAYKSKLASKVRTLQGKIAETQASTYAKVADDIEVHMAKAIEAKRRAIALAVAKIERKHAAKLAKSVAKKGRKVSKAKKATKASPAKKMSVRKRSRKK